MLIKECGKLNAVVNEGLGIIIPDMYQVYVNLQYLFPFGKIIIIGKIDISHCV